MEVVEIDMEGLNVNSMQGRSEDANEKGNKIPTSKGDVKGSRFAHQVIDDDYEEMDMEGSHMVENQADIEGSKADTEPRVMASSNGSRDQFEQAYEDEEVVRLAVSHTSLAKGLESRPGLELGMANVGKTAS